MGIKVLAGLVGIVALAAFGHAETPPERIETKRPSGAVHWADIDPRAVDHVNRRLDEIEWQPRLQGGVLFLGDSITEGAPLTTMFPGLNLRNQGISWDTSDGVLLRLNQVTRHAPDRIFLLIGTNDTNYTDDPSRIAGNIEIIADRLGLAPVPQDRFHQRASAAVVEIVRLSRVAVRIERIRRRAQHVPDEANAPKRRRPPLASAGLILGTTVREVLTHVVQQHVRKRLDHKITVRLELRGR